MKIMDPATLVEAIEGPRISVPIGLVQKLSGIADAVFLAQAAYLSSLSRDTDGWFDLPQLGLPKPDAVYLWGKLGSWQAIIGVGIDAQCAIRERLKKLGLLEERRGGLPSRLYYRVRSDSYLKFIACQLTKPEKKQKSGESRIKNKVKAETGVRKIPKQDSGNPRGKPKVKTASKSGTEPGQESEKSADISIEPSLDLSVEAAEFIAQSTSSELNSSAAAACIREGIGLKKRRRKRPSGIVTWDDDDVVEAERIEASHHASQIATAIASLQTKQKEPVPGLVEMELAQKTELILNDDADKQLSAYTNKLVVIKGYSSQIHITQISGGYYGEVVGERKAIAHSQLVDFARRGVISLFSPE